MADLLWYLTRNTNSFVVKRNGVALTSEPFNLTNTHRLSTSGLLKQKALGLKTTPKGDIVLKKKVAGHDNRPGSSVSSLSLKKDYRGDLLKTRAEAHQNGSNIHEVYNVQIRFDKLRKVQKRIAQKIPLPKRQPTRKQIIKRAVKRVRNEVKQRKANVAARFAKLKAAGQSGKSPKALRNKAKRAALKAKKAAAPKK